MTALGTVKGNVVILDEDAALPEGARVELKLVHPFRKAASAGGSRDLETLLAAARAARAQLPPGELAARVRAAAGLFRGAPGSVDDFIRRKQEDIEWENRRWKDLPEELESSTPPA